VGNVIPEEQRLFVASPALLKERFRVEVRTEHDVLAIDRARAEIEVRDLRTGHTRREPYDALVLSPGAAPIRPRLPGIDLPGIFALRTLADTRCLRAWIEGRHPERAVIAGGGLIGLEMAENLSRRGLSVTIIEAQPQLLSLLDAEMAEPLSRHLENNCVALHLGDAVAGFEPAPGGGLQVRTASGMPCPADVVVLALEVRPDTTLAAAAGLEIGNQGGIRVDSSLRTSDPNIWAVGDAVEVRDVVTGEWCVVPLAGAANRQGRVAADSICGRPARFRGVQSTVVCGVFGLTVALTGASEKALRGAAFPGTIRSTFIRAATPDIIRARSPST
jgi:NADPH-dependent 2,4-dienoyl-CoA reductase/sulfur reductase-like enzyme